MVHLRVPVPINYFFTRNFNSTEKNLSDFVFKLQHLEARSDSKKKKKKNLFPATKSFPRLFN